MAGQDKDLVLKKLKGHLSLDPMDPARQYYAIVRDVLSWIQPAHRLFQLVVVLPSNLIPGVLAECHEEAVAHLVVSKTLVRVQDNFFSKR